MNSIPPTRASDTRSERGRFGAGDAGILAVCAWLLLLTFQNALILRALLQGMDFIATSEERWLVWTHMAVAAFGFFASFGAIVALAKMHNAYSIALAIVAVFWGNPLAKWALYFLGATSTKPSIVDLLTLSAFISISATIYLLLSERVAEIYSTKTRTWFVTHGPQLWNKLRGR